CNRSRGIATTLQVNSDQSFRTFLHRAHARRISWHLLEGATVGVLIACALSSLALPYLWMRGIDATLLEIDTLLLGFVLGLLGAIKRRPNLLSTAQQIE